MFCLDWRVESWGFGEVKVWGFEKKVWKTFNVFGLGYAKMNMWENFIKVCEWCDGCK